MLAAGQAKRVVFLELNEAERYFIDSLSDEGALPSFQRLRREGVEVETFVPDWDDQAARAWRAISPWIVWPSIYSGMRPAEHGIVAFGQDPATLLNRCVWDVLDRAGISVGLMGCLMSYPPRSHGHTRFYVPESLADTPETLPAEARAAQDFCVFAARNYSESFLSSAFGATWRLLRTRRAGVRPSTIARTLAQMPSEWLRGHRVHPQRAILHSQLLWEVFGELYRQHRPRYAALHLNHCAYMQHRYWRASEPHKYKRELSETDQRHFDSVGERERYEQGFSHWIESAFRYSDDLIGRLMSDLEDGDVLMVASGLGVRPMDPTSEIHNPVVRLDHARELLAALDLTEVHVLHQMNPDLTLNFTSEDRAKAGASEPEGLFAHEAEPLFHVQRRGPQVFLELNVPHRGPRGLPDIRHRRRTDLCLPAARFIREHSTNDQSTAHHHNRGFLMVWRKGERLPTTAEGPMAVSAVAPMVLSWFGVDRPEWMHD